MQTDRVKREEAEENEEEHEYETITCCHRVTICPPRIRNMFVTEPVSKCFGRRFTWARFFHFATNVAVAMLGWTVLYLLLGDTMLPTNDGFGFYVLVIFSRCLGTSLSSIPLLKLPPVFGMLIAGLIVRNSGLYDIHEDLGAQTTSKIRTFCLTFIIIRAGLQLSTTSLKTHPMFIMVLALVPCSVEMLVMTLCCRYLLSYEWDWSFMAGTILACMSPVVTVNCILALAEQGYGEDKGLTTILCTAACINDVHIVSLFAISYSIVFVKDDSTTQWWYYVLIGIRDATFGFLAGIALGICFTFIPHRSHKYANWYRMICLVLGCLVCTIGTAKFAVSGGGFLASLVVTFVSLTGWRILSVPFDTTPFRRVAFFLWQLVQPILVGVIGADIELAEQSMSRFGLHLLCILIGLTARSVTVYATTLRTSFNWKERLFVAICWMPKGTLQAALGPMAYELLRTKEPNKETEVALDLVRISVITILFLAPLGATLIATSGPVLLEQTTDEQRRRDRELSYLRILSLLPTPSETGDR